MSFSSIGRATDSGSVGLRFESSKDNCVDYPKRAFDLLRYLGVDLSKYSTLVTMKDVNEFICEFGLKGAVVAEHCVLYIVVPRDFYLIEELEKELRKRVSATLDVQIDYED